MNSQRSQQVPVAPRDDEPELASPAYLALARLPFRELEAVMLRGERPDPDALAGWEHRGTNVAAFTKLLGIKKFIKGFYKTEAGQVYGYNMPVVQNRLDEPWLYKRASDPRRFGFFRVDRVDPAVRDNVYLHALLLDYGRGGNHELDPTSGLRDYLARVERGSDELLLGKAFYALGPLRVPAGYFVLERLRKSDFRR